MITQELTNFIKEQLSAGKSRMEISDMLVKNGWKSSDVDEGFAAAAPSVAPVAAPITAPAYVQPAYVQPVYNPVNMATANVASNPMQSSMPDMVTASPQMAQVPPKKAWFKFVIGFFVIVVLAVAGYFAYGYYQEHYAMNDAAIAGKAFANLVEAKDVSFRGTVTGSSADVPGLSSVLPASDMMTADATVAGAATIPTKEMLSVSGKISLDDSLAELSLKNQSGLIDIEARVVNETIYVKSGAALLGFPGGQWISLKQGEAELPVTLTAEQEAERAKIIAALKTGKALVVKEYADQGTMKHYSVSVSPEALAQMDENLAQRLSSLSTNPIQVWIDPQTLMITRIAGSSASGASVDFTIDGINKGIIVEAPAESKSLEDIMKDMFSIVEKSDAAGLSSLSDVNSSLEDARTKAIAAKARAILSNMRPQAELYWGNEGSGVYGTSNTKVGACTGTGAGSMFTSVKGLKDLVSQMAQTLTSPTLYRCQSTGVRWAVSAKVGPTATDITCVDSSGYSGPVKLLTASDDAICE